MSEQRRVLKALRTEHELLEQEELAMQSAYNEIVCEQEILREEQDWFKSIQSLIEKLEIKYEKLLLLLEEHDNGQAINEVQATNLVEELSIYTKTLHEVLTKIMKINKQEGVSAQKESKDAKKSVALLKELVNSSQKAMSRAAKMLSLPV